MYQSQSDCVIVIPLLLLKDAVDCVELGWDEWKFEDRHDEKILAAGHGEPKRMLHMSLLLSIANPLLSIESWWRDNRSPVVWLAFYL